MQHGWNVWNKNFRQEGGEKMKKLEGRLFEQVLMQTPKAVYVILLVILLSAVALPAWAVPFTATPPDTLGPLPSPSIFWVISRLMVSIAARIHSPHYKRRPAV